MTSGSSYPPVFGHALIATRDGVLRGLAYPAANAKPAAVGLYAGGLLVAAVRADRFDPIAAALEIRFGWCGFRLELSDELFAWADILDVRCLASEAKLGSVALATLARSGRPSTASHAVQTVDDLLLPSPGYRDFEPFRQAVMSTVGPMDVEDKIIFLYRFVLRREPDPPGLATYVRLVRGGLAIADVLKELLGSDEFATRLAALPFGSVFDDDFPGTPVFEATARRRSGDISRRIPRRLLK